MDTPKAIDDANDDKEPDWETIDADYMDIIAAMDEEAAEYDAAALADEDGDGSSSNKAPLKQSKSYTTAKTLNDREQRILKFKLEHLDKEKRLTNHRIHFQQTALKRDLRNINPNIRDDPDKGFFVPTGMTRLEAEKLRDNKRINAPKATRSISLAEFDAMRKIRSEAVRKAAYEMQGGGETNEDGEKKRNRPTNRGVAVPPKIHAVSFTTMAKVVTGTLGTANDIKKKRVSNNNKKESTHKKESHAQELIKKEMAPNQKESKWTNIARNVVGKYSK